ncbi:MAG TPA: hypothetical protein VGH54_04795 [Mycobacterium sp.]|uniref:hypothetical protein n=1 Tax=Mycobacterium sp. TaxID=1785 RepID=UPI002F3E3F72
MHAGIEEVRLPDDQVGLVVEVFRMLADVTRTPEHSGPGVPRHHRGDDGLRIVKERS